MQDGRASNDTSVRPRTPRDGSLLASCFWCEQTHYGEHALSVCSTCQGGYSALRSLEMMGSYPLSDGAIDEALTSISPGNYALGYMDGDTFSVFYVGRSDSDVRSRLHDWVGMPSHYERFASCAKAPWAVRRRESFPVDAPTAGRVGSADDSYTHFAFSYSCSATAAFEKECRNFEDFGGRAALDNETEPISAAGQASQD